MSTTRSVYTESDTDSCSDLPSNLSTDSLTFHSDSQQEHLPRTKTRRFVSKWQLPKILRHRTKKSQPGPSFYQAGEEYLAKSFFSRLSGATKLQKGPLSKYRLSTRKRNQLKAAWLGLKVHQRRVADKTTSALRSTRIPWLNFNIGRRSKQDQDPDSEWSFYQCILRASAGMEALSPRSSNVQVKPRTSKERALAAKKAAADREARELKERNFAPPPPEWVIQPPQNEDKLSEKYKTGEFLGKGGFAICYEGELQPRGNRLPTTYALKIVRAEMSQKKMEDKFRTELQIHAKMRHPNIVEFHRAFTFKQSTYVVLELCSSGSVMDMVKKRKCLSLPEVRRLIMQLCGAVKYMHARNVIHRDLKMGNLFLDESMNLKVGDFGLAAILALPSELEHTSKGAVSRRSTLCGTPNYIAPEILEKAKGGHDHKVDIWAIGVIVFAMLAGNPPFQAMTQNEIYRKAKELDYMWPNACQNDIPDEAKDLVANLLVVDAEARPDLDQIVGHPFFRMHGGRNIPKMMAKHCLSEKPHWLSPHRPRGDVFEPDTARWRWELYAQVCGVGQLPGVSRSIPAAGEHVGVSVYRECVIEEKESRCPTVPLPIGKVYPSNTVSEVPTPWEPSNSLSSPVDVKTAKTEASIPVRQPATEITHPVRVDPRRRGPIQSHAATLRALNAPPRPSRTVIRAAPGPSSAEAQDSASTKSASTGRVTLNATRHELGTAPVRPTASGESQQVRKATSRTTRVTRSKTAEQVSQPPDPPVDPPILTTDQYVDQVYPNPDGVRREKAAQTKVRNASAVQREVSEHLDTGVESSAQSSLPRRSRHVRNAEVLGNRLISLDDAPECIPDSKPDEVLSKLKTLHGELTKSILDTQLHNKTISGRGYGSTYFRKKSIESRPVVLKWVDYTNKFGIGYILENGTVGCVFKEDEYFPVTYVVVAGADRHFKLRKTGAYAEKHQIVPENGAPIEFLESCGREGINRVFVAPTNYRIKTNADGVPEKFDIRGDTSYDSHKRQKLQLWDKFGQYMTKSLGNSDNQGVHALLANEVKHPSKGKAKYEAAGPFIKFYQRLGNVGIWGFGNGSFQFNFPDHTKLVISDDGTWVDFYHLSVRTAQALKEGGTFKAGDLGQRGAFTYPMDSMLRGVYKDHDFKDLVEANELVEKVAFVRDLVNIWVECGGLGRLGEHKWMKWEGMQEPGWKLVWTSVGALGGDDKWEMPEVVSDRGEATL